VDEAHATGLYGDNRSSGLCEQFGLSHRVALQMGTFSKALGGFGAYVAGSRVLIDTLVNQARGFIYSTALPPAVLGAALEAVSLVQRDASLKERLWRNVLHFQTALIRTGLTDRVRLPLRSPIVPFLIGDNRRTVAVSQALLEAGFLVHGIRPPTVPPGTARLRIAISAAHTQTQLDTLATTLAELSPT
jgi:8-amino-7-oxononanoate synthase